MREVMTVLGSISSEDLGFTSMHDHILVDLRFWKQEWKSFIPNNLTYLGNATVGIDNIGLLQRDHFLVEDNLILDNDEVMIAELIDFKNSGGHALVEMSAVGIRVSMPRIQHISEKSGVHVVATTGFYVEQSCPQYSDRTTEQFVQFMRKEIEEGIEDSGIKAGHIKIGVFNLSERDVKILRAAARVSMDTGVAVTVHPGHGGSDGRKISDILIKEGISPERIIIAHSDYFLIEHNNNIIFHYPEQRDIRLDYHKAIMDRGANLGMDCFGHNWDRDLRGGIGERDWQRIAALLSLTEQGYASQIVLGTDSGFKMLLRRYGGIGYSRLTNYVVPTLKNQGVSDFDIRQMTIENPARLLSR